MNIKLLFTGFLLCAGISGYSQTEEEKREIISNYDLKASQELINEFKAKYERKYTHAIEMAGQKGWPLEIEDTDGSFSVLIDVSDDGTPVYYQTHNVNAAISTRTNYLHPGGGLNLNLEGQTMTVGVWEISHPICVVNSPEFQYRCIIQDPYVDTGGGGYHATHVNGTLIAKGDDPLAKGMAPKAISIAYNYLYDLSEMTTAASNGLLISNHSYGYKLSSTGEGSKLGWYSEQARDFDAAFYLHPNYLQVCSAGNNYSIPSLGFATAKNNLTVIAATDAVINSNGDFVFAEKTIFSSCGPTKDMRIKPEITANGDELYSPLGCSAYDYMSGTSMASPNAAGTLLLLQEHNRNLTGSFMRAATLKGLALHTADDIHNTTSDEGPDKNTGWGYLNAKRAVETMNANGVNSIIHETGLANNENHTFDIISDDISQLQVSISWTDPAGAIQTVITDTTPRLVNDLDVRITQGTQTFFPYVLTSTGNTQADNIKDNFERIDIPNANGIYTVTVSHKGVLTNNAQNYSLVITGIKHCSQIPAFVNAGSAPVNQTSNTYATNTITSNVNIPANASAYYKAGQAVVLENGFFAQENSIFHAEIGLPCTSQMPEQSSFAINQQSKTIMPESETINVAQKLLLYPNPASDNVTVEVSGEILSELSIFTIDNKHLLTRKLNSGSEQIDTSGLQEGIYIINAKTTSGKTFNQKLIIK